MGQVKVPFRLESFVDISCGEKSAINNVNINIIIKNNEISFKKLFENNFNYLHEIKKIRDKLQILKST